MSLDYHDPNCSYYTGQQPYIIIADLDMFKQILVKDFDNFSDHAVSYYRYFASNV